MALCELFFFFQAEDGIRDIGVTGVQTCALPISVTNTSGEIQMLRKGAEVMGPRSDFDLLRILSHQLEKLGLGKAFHYKTPGAVFEEIRKAVPAYNVPVAGLLTGGGEATRAQFARNGHAPYDFPAGRIAPANHPRFTG